VRFEVAVMTMTMMMTLRCLDLARSSGVAFTSVIVDARSGAIVAEGIGDWDANPTFHGEVSACDTPPTPHRHTGTPPLPHRRTATARQEGRPLW
jgi:hypothetical protein